MPRIEAATVDEHIRLQTGRVLDAADKLFRERGYRGTDLEAIATEVGLARNSLYRYYRNKDHILVACVQRAMEARVAEMRELAERYPDPRERIAAWIGMQIDTATGPDHATMMLMGEIRQADPELRRDILDLHKVPGRVLQQALGELLQDTRRDTNLLTVMISGMVEAAAGQAIRSKSSKAVLDELHHAVSKLIET